MKHRIQSIHFVGIGGSGMSGIAEVLLNLGYAISGSDIQESAVTRRLAGLGARISIGHDAENIRGVGAIVTSTAVTADVHPVLLRPLDRRLRPADLGERAGTDVRPPVRQAVELRGDAGDRVRRVLPRPDRHVPVREAHRAEARPPRFDHQW